MCVTTEIMGPIFFYIFYMNTCWVPHLEMSPMCLTMASEQIPCIIVVWLWMSDCSFTQHVSNIHLSGYSTISCYMTGATWNSGHLGTFLGTPPSSHPTPSPPPCLQTQTTAWFLFCAKTKSSWQPFSLYLTHWRISTFVGCLQQTGAW